MTDESKVGQIVIFFTNCPTNRNFNFKVLQIKTYSILWFNINIFSSSHISASILSISISSCLYLRANLHQKIMFIINGEKIWKGFSSVFRFQWFIKPFSDNIEILKMWNNLKLPLTLWREYWKEKNSYVLYNDAT